MPPLCLLLRQRFVADDSWKAAIVVTDNLVGWEAALTELAASSAFLEKLEERSDAANPQLMEAAEIAHVRLLSLLANVATSTSN